MSAPMPERISEETWPSEQGHIDRYRWAAKFLRPNEVVLDAACGIGYGAELLKDTNCRYIGVDRKDVPSPTFSRPGSVFLAADLDTWWPDFIPDVSICFETLEHLKNPQRFADMLMAVTGRLIFVSVPIVETVGINPWHLHNFTEDSLRQMFDYWHVLEEWPQPGERSHVWAFKP